jgi:hypothetical protein
LPQAPKYCEIFLGLQDPKAGRKALPKALGATRDISSKARALELSDSIHQPVTTAFEGNDRLPPANFRHPRWLFGSGNFQTLCLDAERSALGGDYYLLRFS